MQAAAPALQAFPPPYLPQLSADGSKLLKGALSAASVRVGHAAIGRVLDKPFSWSQRTARGRFAWSDGVVQPVKYEVKVQVLG